MAKVEKSKGIINHFGVINFVLKVIHYEVISQIIDNKPDSRLSKAVYSCSYLF